MPFTRSLSHSLELTHIRQTLLFTYYNEKEKPYYTLIKERYVEERSTSNTRIMQTILYSLFLFECLQYILHWFIVYKLLEYVATLKFILSSHQMMNESENLFYQCQ